MRQELVINGTDVDYEFNFTSDDVVELVINDNKYLVKKLYQKGDVLFLDYNGRRIKVTLGKTGKTCFVDFGSNAYEVKNKEKKVVKKSSEDEHSMLTPMPGKVLKVLVQVGQKVSIGDPLVVMEAMKMEHTLTSTREAMVGEILYKEGELVDGGVELILFKDQNDS